MKLILRTVIYTLALVSVVGFAVIGTALAQAEPAAQPGMMQFIMGTVQFIGIGFFVYYLLVILPRKTQETEHQKFLSNLKKGDEVVTSGGLLGKVVQVKEESITLELSSSVKIRVLPSHVKIRGGNKPSEEVVKKTTTSKSKKTANNK